MTATSDPIELLVRLIRDIDDREKRAGIALQGTGVGHARAVLAHNGMVPEALAALAHLVRDIGDEQRRTGIIQMGTAVTQARAILGEDA